MTQAKVKTIRITGAGIYGAPTEANPTGEYTIGHEIETEGDLPPGWIGRAEVVGEEPDNAEFVTGSEGVDAAAIRQEVVDEANKRIAAMLAQHTTDLAAANERADTAEALVAELQAKIDASTKAAEAATADEIKSAVGLLDGKTDAHWTKAGLPAVEAVAELTGKTVTREAITEAAPDAKRPA
ncbi:hypothetical protein [Sphingobium sp. WCS2017Hpa-17]|uniref:hypothetical protein n=1 Tax=Sphingobium sp. WCS2017Hpa-17 TaxID=3073638 RepID=UPI00288C522C|nr:hypothetical protein [Sphingobium sp. WCS2017Hpa-17]